MQNSIYNAVIIFINNIKHEKQTNSMLRPPALSNFVKKLKGAWFIFTYRFGLVFFFFLEQFTDKFVIF